VQTEIDWLGSWRLQPQFYVTPALLVLPLLCTQDLTGKAFGIFMPKSMFGALGLEHTTANLFLVSAK
jgi:formate/nitrite transporter FocA (FNT family)